MLLKEIGEFGLLSTDIFSGVWGEGEGFFNDCADVASPRTGRLLLSTDPCPLPLVSFFDGFDPYTFGWFTATINLSDIAACGGAPNYFLSSLEVPDTASTLDVQAFMKGMNDNLQRFGCRVVGGNLKASTSWRAVGTVIGYVDSFPLQRLPLRVDDTICLVGPVGTFWAAVLSRVFPEKMGSRHNSDLFNRALTHPEPLVEAGKVIRECSTDIRCLDCSDGLATSLSLMGRIGKANLKIFEEEVERVAEPVREVYDRCGVSVLNGIMGFGDWQLLCFVPPALCAELEARLSLLGLELKTIGRVEAGRGDVISDKGERLNPMILNENFQEGYNSLKDVNSMLKKFIAPKVFI